jgi:hypothetical protein
MGGAGLPFGLIFVAVLAIVVLVAVYVVVPWTRREARQRQEIIDADESLVYEVPEGQDPTTIVAALRLEGLDATEVMRHGRQRVVISGPPERDDLRPRARAVIAEKADLNLEGDPAANRKITFVDE